MAKALNATILDKFQSCRQCGEYHPLQKDGFCSGSCRNRSRTDHSEETLMRRFWAKVDKAPGFGPNGDCWEWTARLDGRGYGEIKVAGKYKKAHRLALFGMSNLDNELFACHRCDNPQCVRPSHLFPGEPVDNVRDMHNKGRARQCGRQRKLSAAQVREIRRTQISHNKGAAKYGVSSFTIAGVRKGTLYKDVK